jgi:hypothetical protein
VPAEISRWSVFPEKRACFRGVSDVVLSSTEMGRNRAKSTRKMIDGGDTSGTIQLAQLQKDFATFAMARRDFSWANGGFD